MLRLAEIQISNSALGDSGITIFLLNAFLVVFLFWELQHSFAKEKCFPMKKSDAILQKRMILKFWDESKHEVQSPEFFQVNFPESKCWHQTCLMLPWPLWMPMFSLAGRAKSNLGLSVPYYWSTARGNHYDFAVQFFSPSSSPLSSWESEQKGAEEKEDQEECQEVWGLACLPEASGRGEGAAAQQAHATASCCEYLLLLTRVRAWQG